MRWLWLLAMLASCDYVFRLDQVPDRPAPDAAPVPSRWVELAAGTSHTCAIDDQAVLFCWGLNDRGETGVGSTALQIDAPQRVGAATWQAIESRERTTCGIQTDGSLWCWGGNGSGQVGNGSFADQREPAKIDGDTWLSVATELSHTCAIRSDRSLWCWGENVHGQLGDGTIVNQPSKVAVSGLRQWEEVAVGRENTCGIATDHSLWCWGNNDNYQFTVAAPPTSSVPVKIGSDTWAHVALTDTSVCAVTMAGVLRCWGSNSNGELGDSSLTPRAMPLGTTVPDPDRTDWAELAGNRAQMCARTGDGHVYCWGTSNKAQLGVAMDVVSTPVELGGTLAWDRIATGVGHSCAIGVDHTLWCVGNNGYSQFGDGGTSSTVPIQVTGTWSMVSTGLYHTCAINTDGAVLCAGGGDAGQLGTGNRRSRSTLVATSLTSGVGEVSAGHEHTCASAGNSVMCWGANYFYQLGNGTNVDGLAPQTIRAAATSRADQHTCAIDSTTSVMYCWGANESGQIGDSLPGTNRSSPFPILGKQFKLLAVGRYHTCGVDEATKVFCWGGNENGQLGNGNNTDVLTPTTSGISASQIRQITAGGFHTCAVAINDVARCWGGGYAGQLGNGDTGGANTPTVLTTGLWRVLDAGYEHTCGIQNDGTLWCWGSNARGQLGIGSRMMTATPTQVGGDNDWISVATFAYHTCAVRATNQLYCWGDNNEGALADGKAWQTSWVQVP